MAKKIYLADDEQDIREILTEFLSNAGYEVIAYKNGDTLFSAFQEKPCDLVILDIMMPGSDGLSICKKLRTISSQDIKEQKELEEQRRMEQMPKGSVLKQLEWATQKRQMENQQHKKNKTKYRGLEI